MKIAVVGTGQLARMLAQAARDLQMQVCFLRTMGESTESVDGLGDIFMLQSDASAGQVFELLGRPDVITVEKEDVDIALLKSLQQYCDVFPNPDFVGVTKNRLREKCWLNSLGLATAPFEYCDDLDSLQRAVDWLGLPVFVKSCEQGYDGKNQWLLHSQSALSEHADAICRQPCVVEKAVSFTREISVIGVRNKHGEIDVYPATENHHWQGTLLCSFAPAEGLPQWVEHQARAAMETVLQESGYVGVLAMECFVTEQGLLINELAPRVHNSGHWTMQGAEIDQFKAHLLAVGGRFSGLRGEVRHTVMINLLGVDGARHTGAAGDRTVHFYNKSLRPRRKVGHINVVHDGRADIRDQVCRELTEIYSEQESLLPLEAIRQPIPH